MKVRSDFVTNSSSSSFTLMIGILLKNGLELIYEAMGLPDDASMYYDKEEAVDYDEMSEDEIAEYINDKFEGDMAEADYMGAYEELVVKVSPKQLGQVESISAMIEVLKDLVTGDIDEDMSVFRNPNDLSAAEFISALKDVESMKDIKSITITGEEANYQSYDRSYTYDLETGKYTGYENGYEFEKDGASGGEFCFADRDEAEVVYDGLEE